nr:reverse transcriptase domain-containing protein [Tanacetum cinerariifolium]
MRDRLSKLAYFLAIQEDYKMEMLASDVEVTEIGESKTIGHEMEQETTNVVVIKERLKESKDRVVRFGKKGEFAHRNAGPFEILERIGPVAYRLRFPDELSIDNYLSASGGFGGGHGNDGLSKSDVSLSNNSFSKLEMELLTFNSSTTSISPSESSFSKPGDKESDFYSEEIEDFLNDDSILIGVENCEFNMEEDILFLERLLSKDPFLLPPMNPNQTESSIEEPEHSFSIGYEHFNTTLVTKLDKVAESSTRTLYQSYVSARLLQIMKDDVTIHKDDVPIEESKVHSNPLFDDNEINSDELESHVEPNFVESLSNHDHLEEF